MVRIFLLTFLCVPEIDLYRSSFFFTNLKADGQSNAIVITYSNGDSCFNYDRQTQIMIKCNYLINTTRILQVQEGTLCRYAVTIESPLGCPYNCKFGLTGPNCSKCIEGFYGPNCLPCNCSYGICNVRNNNIYILK
jgi:hypothetical protein